MIWQVPRIWDGGDVWIIGGGPSVSRQFEVPDKVVQEVMAGTLPPSAYSSYMSFLHDKHVIGVNVAYMIGDWIDMVFFGDKGFFLAHQQRLADFPGMKVSCEPTTDKVDWVKFVTRDTKHSRGISGNPKMVSWNNNSGAAAINVAVHTGAKRIILLGFDMKLNGSNNQHWHDVYKRGVITGEKRMRNLPFDRHRRGFPVIAQDAQKMGVEILNCNLDSRIECFSKVSLKDLIL